MAHEPNPTIETLHFDLGFLRHSYDKPYVQTPLGRFAVHPHTDATRAQARIDNRAIASMPQAALAKLTHYAVGVKLPVKAPFLLRVHNDDGANGTLPTLFGVKIVVPTRALREYRQNDLARLLPRRPAHVELFGMVPPADSAAADDHLDFLADADLVIDLPTTTAVAIAFSYPTLASTSNQHAAIISDLFIGRSKDLTPFTTYIRNLGEASQDGTGFAVITQLKGEDGAAITLNPALTGGTPSDTIICQYNLSPDIIGTPPTKTAPATPPATQTATTLIDSALIAMTNDPGLRNSHWSVNQGQQQNRYHAGVTGSGVVNKQMAALRRTASRRAMRAAAADPVDASGYEFTINNKTPGHGLDIDDSSITFDTTSQVFSIQVKNTFMRTLATHIKFYDVDGNVISNPPSLYPNIQKIFTEAKEMLHLDTDEEFVRFIYSVYAIMDIPMPFGATTIDVKWPESAASADLLFGGLGIGKWDTTADMLGLLATVLFQFVSPVIFLITGAWVTHSDWYEKLMSDPAVVALVIILAIFLVEPILYLIGFGRYGLNYAINLIASKLVAMIMGNAAKYITKAAVKTLVTDGSEVLIDFFVFKITVSELIDAIPFVGWAAEIAGVAATGGALLEAGIDILQSPATYTVNVTRRLEVVATVSPDPLHGTLENPAIWPTEATHFKAVLQYKNGTAYTLTGALPVEQSERSTPITVTFDDVPTGGDLQITFGVYSDTNWLAGNWSSAWTPAVLPPGAQTLDITGSIIENLVPLTMDTQYLFDSKIVYTAASGHQWSATAQPSAVITDLNPDGLNDVVAITSNNNAYMLGYTWQASNQNVPVQGTSTPTNALLYTFQNINTLSNPEAALKFSNAGFSATTFLAYEQFGPEPLFSAPSSVLSDLDDGVIDATLQQSFASAGYPLPTDISTVTLTTVQSTVEWTMTLPNQNAPTYQLNRQSDGSVWVYLYPTDTVGQNNFYLDSSSNVHQLRAVTLDDTTPFDMNQTQTHGAFVMQTVNTVVVHPANYAIAVSFGNHHMEIVPILQQAVPDAEAVAGIIAGGKGVRQGLMLGPKAVAVTQDGRILVLEIINRRVQSFDINGNPVPSFEIARVATLDASDYAADLNAGFVSVPLRNAFAAAGYNLSQHWQISAGNDLVDIKPAGNGQLQLSLNGGPLSSSWTITDTDGTVYAAALVPGAIEVTQPNNATFQMPFEASVDLDLGYLGARGLAAFKAASVPVSQQASVTGNGLYVAPADCESDLTQNVVPQAVTDALASVQVTLPAGQSVISIVTNDVQAESTVWVINDADADVTYQIEVDAVDNTKLQAIEISPFMYLHVDGKQSPVATSFLPDDFEALRAQAENANEKYLDMATEMKGYIYVLGYSGSGAQPSNYFLDIYDPLGRWLSRTPDTKLNPAAIGVNAGRIAIDMWRNLFTLNFEAIAGPNGRVEPSVSMWTPSTPTVPS